MTKAAIGIEIAALQPEKPAHKAMSEAPPKFNFYEGHSKLSEEVIEGIARESQIVAFAGPYGVGKSPTLVDLTVATVRGIPWCGRRISPRPVIAFDFESSAAMYKRNVLNIANRLGVRPPEVPGELDPYLMLDDAKQPPTARLLAALEKPKYESRVNLIKEALKQKPKALVIVDPVEMMFPIDKTKGQHVLWLYKQLRLILSDFPGALFWLTFNLRKRDRKSTSVPCLLNEPRDWLEEVSGSLDILNRCDVRLGIDLRGDDIRVVNGVRRGEDMHPLLIRPVGDHDNLAGFELCAPNELDLISALTPTQREHWAKLPSGFRFDEVADKIVPRASLSRLLGRAKSLGLLAVEGGTYRKR